MSYFPHSFEAPLVRHGVGRVRKLWYTVLFLPAELAAALPFDRHPQLRVEGEIADQPYVGAFISAGQEGRYCMVSPALCRAAGLSVDDPVTMRFKVADQNAVEVPAVLACALADDAAARVAWDALTVGRQRALAHHIGAAKTAATVDRRVAAVIAGITRRPPAPSVAADVARLARILPR